ncbi:MAG: hypothetical protein IJG23_04915 [Clostridia bacterium]|nr:hypothetical protein [Clostridia bacterium]
MKDFSVTVLIGATSESTALKKTVKSIVETCDREDIEKIIIVKSKTATKACNEAIADLEKSYPRLVEGYEQNRPYMGGGIRDGADITTSSHFLVFPGDLAIGLESVPKMIEMEKQMPWGIVKASRWLLPGSFHDYPPVRKFFNKTAQCFLRILFHTRLTDMTIPVQVMPTALYRKIQWREVGFPFATEFVLCPLKLGIPFEEVPAACYQRTEGHSSNSGIQTAMYLKTALRIRFTKPEKLLKQTERKNK